MQHWIARHYQRPAVDQDWLADCAAWITAEYGLEPTADLDRFVEHVEAQLLQSNLADSTVPGSGVDPLLFAPDPRRPRQKKTTGPTPLLVEIKSITDIAHSAFSLLNTHQTRLDRADLGLAHEEHPDDDDGPVPRFPRGMLRFELSDGATTFRAIEFRPLPQLELGTTPLGYKMFLKSTPIRNGIAFLEPANVVLKGYRTEDHDINSEQVFLSSLRKRLGRPDPPPEAPQPPPVQPARPQSPPDDMYADDEVDPDVLREMAIQMDEAIALQENHRIRPPPLGSKEKHATTKALGTTTVHSSLKTASVKASPYFNVHASGSKLPDIGLSPRPFPPPNLDPDFDIGDDDDIEPSDVSANKHGATSARPPPSAKRPSSPDMYDDFSDIDVDESFLEQVGVIEQVALSTAANKGKGKATTIAQSTTSHGRPSATPSGSASATRPQSSTKRATSASSMSGSTEVHTALSTQSSSLRLPRDPSLIVISSSEDETPKRRGQGSARPLDIVQRRGHERKGMGQDDDDVIDISD